MRRIPRYDWSVGAVMPRWAYEEPKPNIHETKFDWSIHERPVRKRESVVARHTGSYGGCLPVLLLLLLVAGKMMNV